MSPPDARRRPAWDPDGAQTSRQTSVEPDGTRYGSSTPSTCDPVDQAITSCAAFDVAPDRLAVCRVDDGLTIDVEGADANALELLVAPWVTDVVTGAPLLLAVAERVDAHGVQPVRELKPALVLLARGKA